jgi:hypothetical protein
VEQMKNAGEFPVVAKKGMMGRVKDKVTGHWGAFSWALNPRPSCNSF